MQAIRTKFKITCRKCDSEDVVINIEEGRQLSEVTFTSGSVSIGCNACKQNDLFL